MIYRQVQPLTFELYHYSIAIYTYARAQPGSMALSENRRLQGIPLISIARRVGIYTYAYLWRAMAIRSLVSIENTREELENLNGGLRSTGIARRPWERRSPRLPELAAVRPRSS